MTNQSYSDFTLEAYAAGDLPEEQSAALRADLAESPALKERLDILIESNKNLLEHHPASGVWLEVQRRLKNQTPQDRQAKSDHPRKRLLLALSSALCVVFVLAVFPTSVPDSTDQGFRTKGATPELHIFQINTENSPRRLPRGALVSEGTRLQVSVRNAGQLHAMIVSLDGRGALTTHFPSQGESSLIGESVHSLKASYTLDDAPDYETFVLITSESPLIDFIAREQAANFDTPEAFVAYIKSRCTSCAVATHPLQK